MGLSTWHPRLATGGLLYLRVASSRKVTDRGIRHIGLDLADAPPLAGGESVVVEIERIDGRLATTGDGLASFVITYSDGSQEDGRATLLEVSQLATDAGLHLAHAEDVGSFRWAGRS